MRPYLQKARDVGRKLLKRSELTPEEQERLRQKLQRGLNRSIMNRRMSGNVRAWPAKRDVLNELADRENLTELHKEVFGHYQSGRITKREVNKLVLGFIDAAVAAEHLGPHKLTTRKGHTLRIDMSDGVESDIREMI